MNFEKFKTWLESHGAIVLEPTNVWEVVRFKGAGGVSVIYKNKHDELTFTGESFEAMDAYKNKKAWTSINKKRNQMTAIKHKLATRDGKRCIVDLMYMDFKNLTVEHLFSHSQGGTDNINNLGLACEYHNKAMGAMSVVQKIEYIVKQRLARTSAPKQPTMKKRILNSLFREHDV